MTPTKEEIEVWKKKADLYDKLEDQIYNLYYDKDGNERGDDETDLVDIGEAAATFFGYL